MSFLLTDESPDTPVSLFERGMFYVKVTISLAMLVGSILTLYGTK